MPSGFEQDPHSQDGNACPRNLFGIIDYTELQLLETVFTIKRTEQLAKLGISGKFGVPHLRGIHCYLFQDVFTWAGEFRVVNISKGNSMFGPALHIGGALADALDKLSREVFLQGLSAQPFATRAAFYLGEINAIHPFREGNGRTQREFLRQLALQAGHPLSWAGFTQQKMVNASILSHTKGDNSELSAIVDAALLSTRGVTP